MTSEVDQTAGTAANGVHGVPIFINKEQFTVGVARDFIERVKRRGEDERLTPRRVGFFR
jgi:hypothetical protein